ncbi:ATP-binding protein [Streptomyces sp. NPDC006798]|uniref:ATP-binding protein n=1 Tax=Streptomyces sp. NPDC006798 TaxID=3155462 RepID=UPI00340E43F4
MNTSAPDLPVTVRVFAQRLISSPRGAHRARALTRAHFRAWEIEHDAAYRAEQVVAEFAANAVRHARVAGRGFKLGLSLDRLAGIVRVEITDPRGERLPRVPIEGYAGGFVDGFADGEGETGRGLLMVAVLASRWGWEPYPPSGKTVWAEIDLGP